MMSRAPLRQLAAGLGDAAWSANAWRPLSRGGLASGAAFTLGWPVSEMPIPALALGAVTTARLLRSGSLRRPAGRAALALEALSAAALLDLHRTSLASVDVVEAALREGLGSGYRQVVSRAGLTTEARDLSWRQTVLPAWISRQRFLFAADLPYGPAGKRNLLDVWRRRDLDERTPAPVIVQIPGGGWVMGDKRNQAYPLLSHLVAAGWVCVPINYRWSPRATFPDQIVDVKRALAWVKANIARYGGDPDFVAITGGSAGGHLSSLAAFSPNAPEFQPGFEDADTSVAAAVPFYGPYDLIDWDGRGGPAHAVEMVARLVLKTRPGDDPEGWRRASPIHWAGADAPPTMLVHGTNDSLVPVDVSRRMARVLGERSSQPVVYAELPKAQHAFDIFGSVRTVHTVRAVERFLAYVRARRLDAPSSATGAAPVDAG
ncbi:MAG: alpha/beta hydrolase fold domain-containing protein [Acidimicrobiales bacterium]